MGFVSQFVVSKNITIVQDAWFKIIQELSENVRAADELLQLMNQFLAGQLKPKITFDRYDFRKFFFDYERFPMDEETANELSRNYIRKTDGLRKQVDTHDNIVTFRK